MRRPSDGKMVCDKRKDKSAEVFGLACRETVMWTCRQVGTRWGCGLFVGVKQKNGELVVTDEETKKVRHVRTPCRIPEAERW